MKRKFEYKSIDGLEEKVLLIRRLSKKTKGGNKISFSALVVVGDMKGKVGIGLGHGLEVPQAIKKGLSQARKNIIVVPINNETLPHDIRIKYKGSQLLLRPASQGVGLKVGSVARPILSLAGIANASGKILKSRNQITNAYAVMEALKNLKSRATNQK
jgi:small subunit ribosomal protein S5